MQKDNLVRQWADDDLMCFVARYKQPFMGTWHCGYVKVPHYHAFHGKHYNELPEQAHEVNGGVTFSRTEEDGTIFGFDTIHYHNQDEPFDEERTAEETKRWAAILKELT